MRNREVVRDWVIYIGVLGIVVSLVLSSCVAQPPTHNERGGYIEACDEMPGLLGDDC